MKFVPDIIVTRTAYSQIAAYTQPAQLVAYDVYSESVSLNGDGEKISQCSSSKILKIFFKYYS